MKSGDSSKNKTLRVTTDAIAESVMAAALKSGVDEIEAYALSAMVVERVIELQKIREREEDRRRQERENSASISPAASTADRRPELKLVHSK